MEPGLLTKVFHDFFTSVDGELSLVKGDHFLIHSVVDKHWCYGESRGRTGKFPSNHLVRVDIPDIKETESLFVSIAAFRGEQDGDLSFGEGELIVGIQQLETNWYLGYIDIRKGVFPYSHVWHLDPAILKKPSQKKSVRKRARVKTSLKAQLDEELDLREGETVTVLEILDDGWVRGITDEGKEGTFPESFVSYIEDSGADQTDRSSDRTEMPNYNPMDAESLPNSVLQGGAIFKDFGQTHSSNCFEEPAPSYYDLFPETAETPVASSRPSITVSQPPIETSQAVSLPEDTLNPLGVEPYAITLFPFNAQFPNELSFAAGEVVHLVKHLDSEWAEGTIDDAKGFFPVSYVNIIVNCTDVKEDQANRTVQEVESKPQDHLEAGTSVKVDYTFDAQMDGDLSVAEGDIVTVVGMANDDWVSVKNKEGAVGLCPRAYLNSEIHVVSDGVSDILDDFVVMRHDKKTENETEEERPKRLSEPHRPAPPAPAPGRMPLQKQSAADEKSPGASRESEREDEISPTVSEKQKRAEKRQNVISELVITEKEYVRDLKITYETFNLHNPNFLESRGVDVVTLFGNIVEVIQVAEELLDLVLRAMKGCDEDYQTIAPCFLKMADKLQGAYGKYCGNHEAALALLKKYEDNREIMNIFEKGIETLKRQIACFDMSSILIKPVQRILKYPLMLYELIKCTEENHPDRKGIEEAWKAMTAVASYINEYKRRKDLVSKYLDGENTLMRKMAKLTMHSVAKKSSRLSAKLSASLGVTNLSADPEFEELERQFKALEKCAWQLSKDVEQCLLFINDEAVCGEVLSDLLTQYYSGTADIEIRRFRDTREAIRSQYVQNLRTCIDQRVNAPVNYLITLLEGPAVLITKRYDKLLDYDNAISRSDKNKESRIAQEELASAKNNFEALNQQLMEELPLLIDAATSMLATCIGEFANARKLLSGRITKRYLSLSESATQVTPQDILESFLVNHNLVWNQITRNTFAGAAPRVEEMVVEFCPQNERQRNILKDRYPPDRFYIAKEDIPSTSSHDLSATKGTLIAVIKKQDPMGDSARWFVDNGVAQGFLPSKSLQPVVLAQSSSQPYTNVGDAETTMPDLMSLDSPEKVVSRSSSETSQTNWYSNLSSEDNDSIDNNSLDAFNQPQRYQNIVPEFYYAAYDFQGNMPGTLTVTYGQALKLIRRHDEKGNDAWWLMEDRAGNKGYVPHNYLNPPPTAK